MDDRKRRRIVKDQGPRPTCGLTTLRISSGRNARPSEFLWSAVRQRPTAPGWSPERSAPDSCMRGLGRRPAGGETLA
jgi:hypothetical protein